MGSSCLYLARFLADSLICPLVLPTWAHSPGGRGCGWPGRRGRLGLGALEEVPSELWLPRTPRSLQVFLGHRGQPAPRASRSGVSAAGGAQLQGRVGSTGRRGGVPIGPSATAPWTGVEVPLRGSWSRPHRCMERESAAPRATAPTARALHTGLDPGVLLAGAAGDPGGCGGRGRGLPSSSPWSGSSGHRPRGRFQICALEETSRRRRSSGPSGADRRGPLGTWACEAGPRGALRKLVPLLRCPLPSQPLPPTWGADAPPSPLDGWARRTEARGLPGLRSSEPRPPRHGSLGLCVHPHAWGSQGLCCGDLGMSLRLLSGAGWGDPLPRDLSPEAAVLVTLDPQGARQRPPEAGGGTSLTWGGREGVGPALQTPPHPGPPVKCRPEWIVRTSCPLQRPLDASRGRAGIQLRPSERT